MGRGCSRVCVCVLQALGKLDVEEKGKQGKSWPKLCAIVRKHTGVDTPGPALSRHNGNAAAAAQQKMCIPWARLA